MSSTTILSDPAEVVHADTVVRGRLVGSEADVDILITDGRIDAIVPATTGRGRTTHDFSGKVLLPGMVDGHVHSLSHEGEGIAAATLAAACGGVTTVIEMPFDHSGPINSLDRLRRKKELAAAEAHVDIALLGTSEPGGGWRRLEALRSEGAIGFKVSLFDTNAFRFPRIDDAELLNVLAAVRGADATVCIHAENNEIIKAAIEAEREGGDDPLAHVRSRPPVSETLGVLTAIECARATGARVHVCHASLPRSVDYVRAWADDGADVTLETCPHYLLLDADDMRERGTRLKINPPLRGAAERKGMWDRLAAGQIDVISSDHAPWPTHMKDHRNVFDNASGAPGVETVYPLLLAEAYRRGPEPFAQVVRAATIAPARRFGLDARKGSLEAGKDADIVVFDPAAEWTLDESRLHSHAGWSPYHGREVTGRISHSFVRGRLVYDGEARSRPGGGNLIESGWTR